MKYLANSFSGQMLTELGDCTIHRKIIIPKLPEVDLSEYKSVIGHQDLADMLGVEYNREFVTLHEGDELLVAQVIGGRLPEGCTELPDGVVIEYHRYTFEKNRGS